MSNGLSSGHNFSIGGTTTGCKSVVHAFNSRSELNVFELGQIPDVLTLRTGQLWHRLIFGALARFVALL